MFVWWQPRWISWWRSWWSVRSHLRCIPPLGWLLHKLIYCHFLFVTLSWGFFCSCHFYEYKLTNSKNNHEHCEMMLCNDFPGWWEGYCTLLCMIPSRQPGKSLHSIISQFVVVLANLLFHLLKCLGLKHQRRQGWQGWMRGRQQGELCVRRHFRWCHPPTWRSVQW